MINKLNENSVLLNMEELNLLNAHFVKVTESIQKILNVVNGDEEMERITSYVNTMPVAEQPEIPEYEEEETRELYEYDLSEEEKESADEEIGEFMDHIYEWLEAKYGEVYCGKSNGDTEKDRYIGRKIQLLQEQSFAHFCRMSEGIDVIPVGRVNPDIAFPFKRL